MEHLLDAAAVARIPHTGPALAPGLGSYWEALARERRPAASVELEVSVRGPPEARGTEEKVEAAVHDYFATESALAEIDLRVNREEGWAALKESIPLLLVASLVAAVFYYLVPSFDPRPGVEALSALPALVFAVVAWVLLWDPIEQLLFDAYLLRLRRNALDKLSRAPIRFRYASKPSSA